jgi:hypothetical protein
MNMLWQALIAIMVVCAFLASMRIAVVGLNHLPSSPWLSFITHDRWAASLFILLPSFVGSFARREVSSLPWAAFSKAAARHGPVDGLITALLVLSVELWLLWIPAHSYVINHPDLDRRARILARCLNLAVGLLLLTPQNPVYKLIELMPAHDPDDY